MNARIVIASLVVLTGCPAVEKAGDGSGGGGVPCEVQMVFDTYCQNNATCHIAGGAQGPDLSASGSATSITLTAANGMKFVTIGDVANSWLAQKILPGTPGQMPPVGEPMLPDADAALIIGWVGGVQFDNEGCGAATDTDGMTMSSTAMTDASSTTGPELLPCGIEDVDASVDATMAVDAGDAATQIPTVIGEVLVNNCGCHYAETQPAEYGAAYAGAQAMATLDDFQGDWVGVIPGGFDGMPAHAAILERLTFAVPMPPAAICDPGGEAPEDCPGMSQADFDLLSDWLTMGAPDGATYEPP